MPTTDLPTIAAAAAAIRAGRLNPVELLEQCLQQIHTHDPQVRAWVQVDEAGARQTAAERAREAARGELRGPLHGIPLGIKDIIDVAGWPTEAGSPLCRGQVAQADAPLVAALRRAGAVILGKTVTVEFACFDPSPTRNPWNLTHTPGGSSSGSAAAVATRMCLGALGTQTGGSLVRPSTYCGIATCKPTFGRLSIEGIVPVSIHLDHPGPMARTVADLELMLRCLTDGAEIPLELPENRPPRLGVVQHWIDEDADATIREATEAALGRLRAAGAQIEPVRLPTPIPEILAMHRRIMSVDAAAYHRLRFADHRAQYGPMITTLLDEGLRVLGVDYAAALDWQRRWRQQTAALLAGFDALIAPSTDTTAPPTLATTGTPRFQAAWSLSGLPLVSLPCGLGTDGLPAAVQVIGRHGQEADVLRIAAWCERQFEFDARPGMLVL